jgi:hypothetical protein
MTKEQLIEKLKGEIAYIERLKSKHNSVNLIRYGRKQGISNCLKDLKNLDETDKKQLCLELMKHWYAYFLAPENFVESESLRIIDDFLKLKL